MVSIGLLVLGNHPKPEPSEPSNLSELSELSSQSRLNFRVSLHACLEAF